MVLPTIRRSTQISLLTIALLGGIFIGRGLASFDADLLVAVSIAGAALLILKSKLAFPILVLTALLLGVWRGNETIFTKTLLGQHIGQKVTLTGVIADDPARTDKNWMVFALGNVKLGARSIDKTVRIQTNYKQLLRGYRVEVTGKLATALGASPARMGFGTVTIVSTDTGPLEQLRERFFAALHSVLPDQLAGFGLGLLVGARALIDRPLQDTLAAIGLSHLIAVSGYNLTILIRAAERAMRKVSLFTATATSLWLILGFLLVAGFSASIVRAALVSGLAIVGAYYGRRLAPMTLIAVPAAVTALYNPDYLTRDVGWQLSFLAFFGILVFAPLVRARLKLRDSMLTGILVESLAAQLLTTPLIMYIFGSLSLVSPLANAAILPLVPLAMLLCFMVGLTGLLVPPLLGIVALPAAGLLALMLGVVQWLSQVPGANHTLYLSFTQMLLIYIAITVVTILLSRRVGHLNPSLQSGSALPKTRLA